MFGVMDKDVSPEMLLGVPELYRTGHGAGVSEKKTKQVKFSVCLFVLLIMFYLCALSF